MFKIEDVDELMINFVKMPIINVYKNSKVIWATDDKANEVIKNQGTNLQIPMCNLFRSEGYSTLANKHNFTYNLNCRFNNQLDSNECTEVFLDSKNKINDKINIESIKINYNNEEINFFNPKEKFIVVKISFNITVCC